MPSGISKSEGVGGSHVRGFCGVKDFTVSNGTLLPKGSNIEMAANSVNRDSTIHENPDQYNAY